jgi:hypothetical protein
MVTKERISFDFSRLHIPPWVMADYEVVYVPLPADFKELAKNVLGEFNPFAWPAEALDETGTKLVAFQEKRWMGIEREDRRPLPAMCLHQGMLRPEAFSHIELADMSPEELGKMMSVNGLVVAPTFGSQRRFIASRFFGVTGISKKYAYREMHPIDVDVKRCSEDVAARDMIQSVGDIFDLYFDELGGAMPYAEQFTQLCGGSLSEAVILSEYARKSICRKKPAISIDGESLTWEKAEAVFGGVISYYEVLLVTRGLFKAMGDLIDFSVSDGSVTKLKEQLTRRESNETASIAHRLALNLLIDDRMLAAKRTNEAMNLGEHITRTAFDYLNACVFSTDGAIYGSLIRDAAPIEQTTKRKYAKVSKAFEPQHCFYIDNEPRYLQNRYCEGSFSAALAAQFLSTLADPAPWKRCDNPECQAWFKHHFTTRGRSNPKATSCSPKCSTRKRNRLYNMEASAIRTAKNRYKTTKDALVYIEKRLGEEIPLDDLPNARKRWEKKLGKLS